MINILDELERLSKEATLGPWWDDSEETSFIRSHPKRYVLNGLSEGFEEDIDIQFICLMRNNIDTLVKVARAAEAALENIECRGDEDCDHGVLYQALRELNSSKELEATEKMNYIKKLKELRDKRGDQSIDANDFYELCGYYVMNSLDLWLELADIAQEFYGIYDRRQKDGILLNANEYVFHMKTGNVLAKLQGRSPKDGEHPIAGHEPGKHTPAPDWD